MRGQRIFATRVGIFSIMVCVYVWPDTMCTRECVRTKERAREKQTHSSSSEGMRRQCWKRASRLYPAFNKLISGAHCGSIITWHSAGTCCEVSQVGRRMLFYPKYLLFAKLTQLRAGVPVHQKTLCHRCARVYHFVLCEGDARPPERKITAPCTYDKKTITVSVSEILQPQSTRRFVFSTTIADIPNQRGLP